MLIGGLDVGTTGCKITVYDENGTYISNSYKEYNVMRSGGEHEIDANEIFESVCAVIKDISKKYSLSAIGITTFGESFAMLDKNDNVLLNSMLYTDPRGDKQCKYLAEKIGEEKITDIAKVKPHSMYALPKIMWIKENKPEIYKKADKVLLMEDFIVYKLTGARQIDYSLAARTMAFDIVKKCWSKEILDAAEIPESLMSKPVPPGTDAGDILPEMAQKLGLSENTKIINGCHDQVAAAVGSGVFLPGEAVDGTGTVECVTPVFDEIPKSKALYDEGYCVVPYVSDNTYVCYALSFTGGAVLKWYRDNFAKYEQKICKESGENVFKMLDGKVKDRPGDILVLPHFAGAANPYMDTGSKGAIIGLTLEHDAYDIYKALMEGVTYEIMTNIEHLKSFGIKLKTLYASGGGAASAVWLKIKADILNREIVPLEAKEAGACGTCMLAAVAMGIYKDLETAKKSFVRYKEKYLPDKENAKIYEKRYEAYKDIYKSVRPIIEKNSF